MYFYISTNLFLFYLLCLKNQFLIKSQFFSISSSIFFCIHCLQTEMMLNTWQCLLPLTNLLLKIFRNQIGTQFNVSNIVFIVVVDDAILCLYLSLWTKIIISSLKIPVLNSRTTYKVSHISTSWVQLFFIFQCQYKNS